MARLRTGEFHLVVVARTDRGDYVLDNLSDRVMPGAAPAMTGSCVRPPTTCGFGSRSADRGACGRCSMAWCRAWIRDRAASRTSRREPGTVLPTPPPIETLSPSRSLAFQD
ncbi:MAG: transglutaminase-like cysteine peptidase [Methylacidiphilales bacterium]|nr:transglutaminase-like cysteine peptidase [Candidatus Methylacidiphilales bacterium]